MAAMLKFLIAPPLNMSSIPSSALLENSERSLTGSTPGSGMWAINRKTTMIASVIMILRLRSGRRKASIIAWSSRGLVDLGCDITDLLSFSSGTLDLGLGGFRELVSFHCQSSAQLASGQHLEGLSG